MVNEVNYLKDTRNTDSDNLHETDAEMGDINERKAKIFEEKEAMKEKYFEKAY